MANNIITEATIEAALEEARVNAADIRSQIRRSKAEIETLKSKLLKFVLECDLKEQELRWFRMTYPTACKLTKE
jgi:hypothetical protein